MLKRKEGKKKRELRGETQFFKFILDPTFWQLFLVGLGPTLSAYFASLISFLQALAAGEHLGGNIVMNVDKRIRRFVLVREGARVERSMRHHDTTMRQRIFLFYRTDKVKGKGIHTLHRGVGVVRDSELKLDEVKTKHGVGTWTGGMGYLREVS